MFKRVCFIVMTIYVKVEVLSFFTVIEMLYIAFLVSVRPWKEQYDFKIDMFNSVILYSFFMILQAFKGDRYSIKDIGKTTYSYFGLGILAVFVTVHLSIVFVA